MKKLAVFAALGAALALAIGSYSLAAPGKDYSGPKCTDISGGFGDGYTTPGGGTEAFVNWTITVSVPSCKTADYTLNVINGATFTVTSQTLAGNGSQVLSFSIDMGPAGSAPQNVCIYATSRNGNSVSDRAPDSSCVPLQLNGPPAGQGFN